MSDLFWLRMRRWRALIAPVAQSVPTGLIRLRTLNACNARFLELSMEAEPVTVIASDGRFLSTPVEAESILMSPGERYEVLVDMSTIKSNALNVNMNGGRGRFFAKFFWRQPNSDGFVTDAFPNERL